MEWTRCGCLPTIHSPPALTIVKTFVPEATNFMSGAHGLSWARQLALCAGLGLARHLSQPKKNECQAFKGNARTRTLPGEGRREPLVATMHPREERTPEMSQRWRNRARTLRNMGSFYHLSPISSCKWNLKLSQLNGLRNRLHCLSYLIGFSVIGKGMSVIQVCISETSEKPLVSVPEGWPHPKPMF